MGKGLKLAASVFIVFSFFVFVNKSSIFAQEANGGEPTAATNTSASDDSNATVMPISATDASTSPVPISARTTLRTERSTNKAAIQEARTRNIEINKELMTRKLNAKTKKVEKLTDASLKNCEAKSEKIKSRLDSSTNLGELNHKRLEDVVVLVDNFYTQKLVPGGQVLSNYADLKAEIAANEANVQTLLTSAKASAAAFDCSSADPKGDITNFRTDMKNLIAAEKMYRESVHNFVKAVLALAKTTKVGATSITPVPSVTVEPTVAQ